MDAILVIAGQNGRPARTEAAPQKATGDVAAAFSRALAALEGETAADQTDEAEMSEEDVVSPEEAASEEDSAEADTSVEAPGDDSALIPDLLEEDLPELAAFEAPPGALSADEGKNVEAAQDGIKKRSEPNLALVAPTAGGDGAAHQKLTVVPEEPSLDVRPSNPADTGTTRPDVQRLPTGAVAFMAPLTAKAVARAIAEDNAKSGEAKVLTETETLLPEAEAAPTSLPPKTAEIQKPMPQTPAVLAFETALKASGEGKGDEGGMRLQNDLIGPVHTESFLSQSRPVVTMTATPLIESRPVLHAIAEASIKAQDGTIELRLSPEELGRVRISMSQNDLGLSVVLNVDRDDTLALLRRHASELSASLREAGLGEATIEFAGRDQNLSQDSQRRGPIRQFGILSDAGHEMQPAAVRPSGDGGLDIRM